MVAAALAGISAFAASGTNAALLPAGHCPREAVCALPMTPSLFRLLSECVLPPLGSSQCRWRSGGASLMAACSGATGPSMWISAAGQLTSQTRSWSSTEVRPRPIKCRT